MNHEGRGAFAEVPALACAVCGTPIGLLNVTGVGWFGSEGIDPADLARIVCLARTDSGFFETILGTRYCAGIALREELGVLCVLDDQARAPLSAHQRDLLRMLGNQVEALRRAESNLVRLRPLGYFARGIAHDMNNALQTIVGALNTVEKLIETDTLERIPRFMAAAQRSAQRSGELTRSLQHLARREPGSVGSVDLNSFVRSLEELIRRICGERIALRFHLADPAPVVECDPAELEDVMLSLVVNAFETLTDGGEIALSTRNGASPCVCVQNECVYPAPGTPRRAQE